MSDDFDTELLRLLDGAGLRPVAEGIIPEVAIPAGASFLQVAALSLVASGHFGALPLDALPSAAAYVAETSASQRQHGQLPGDLGVLSYGQVGAAQGVVSIDEVHAGVQPLTGDVEVCDDAEPVRVLLRARDGRPAAVHLFGHGREYVVAVRPGGRVTVGEVERATSEVSERAIVDPDGPHLAAISAHPPPVAKWVEGADAQPWLLDAAVERAASPWALDLLSAAGLIERLWVPSEPSVRRRTVLGNFTPPGHHARDWARSLSGESAQAAERAAAREVARLITALDDDPRDPSEALDLALRRDDIESVRAVLRMIGRGASLDPPLAHLDDLGRARWPAFPVDEAVRGDERLRCVRWCEPDAWWALITEA